MDILALYSSTEICISLHMLFNCLAHERDQNNEAHIIIDVNYYILELNCKFPETWVCCIVTLCCKFNHEKHGFRHLTKSLS